MSKLLKTLLVLIVMYIIPLVGNPGLLWNIRVALLMIAGVVMFLSQPEMKISEATEKKSTDGYSLYVILLGGALSQILAIVEWAYFNHHPSTIGNSIVFVIGVLMLVGGLSFRIWAIGTLDKFFTATVQIKEDHRVIQSGPYRIVRHPSYLGSLIAIIGSTLVVEAPVSALIAAMIMIYAYEFRTRVEESALVGAFGAEYQQYIRNRKYKIIPLVW